MTKRSISVLQIMPGYISDVESRFSTKLNEFVKFSKGTIISTNYHGVVVELGSYKVVLVAVGGMSKFKEIIYFFIEAYKEAKRINNAGGLDLIVCYDPLKTGIFGWLLKIIFKCKFIVEVNGVYNSPVLYKSYTPKFPIKKLFYPRIQQFIIRRVDALKCLFPSQLSGFYIPDRIRQYIFFNFTDISVKKYEFSNTRTILTIGFPAYIKGMDLLIIAFNALQSDFPDWKLKMYGHFSTVDLEKLLKLKGKNNNIEIKRPVHFSDIPAVIDGCDIFVLASRTEAMGRVLLEAMARSKARIGARIDGIPTVINDNEDGLLFEANNADDLERKMRILIESEADRKRLAEAGYKRFNNEFTISQYSDHVRELYYDVVNIKR